MRVLWFSHFLAPAVHRRLGTDVKGSGHWVAALLEVVRHHSNAEIAIVTAAPGMDDQKISEDGVDYFVVGQKRRKFSSAQYSAEELEKCAAVVARWQPDVVHVHGSEWFYGLLAARQLISPPTLISLQGVLQAYVDVFWGAMNVTDRMRYQAVHQVVLRRGLFRALRDLKSRCRDEIEILKGAQHFAGRTTWDRAQLRAVNPDASYAYVGEILRPLFYETTWDIDDCRRHSIVFTNARGPRRGVETILEAVALLKREFPDVRLRLGGLDPESTYGKFLFHRVRRLSIGDQIELPGYLDDKQMAKLLSQSHVFALSSYLENSPNSLCEAQLVGMPCIAADVGGVSDLVVPGHTGELFPHGDAALLAEKIRAIFLNDALAMELGREARRVALRRHSPEEVCAQLMDAYRALTGTQNETVAPQEKQESLKVHVN